MAIYFAEAPVELAFSNVDDPDIVVCVIVENASSTGASAKYIARQLFDAYYNYVK